MSLPRPSVLAAAPTPLAADLAPDAAGLAAHVTALLAQGLDGVLVLGTTGEGPSFSVDERLGVLDGLAAAGAPFHRLLVATGCPAVPDTVRLSRHALALGAAGTVVLPPYYYAGVDTEGLYAAYSRIIEGVGHDGAWLYLYNFPYHTGLALEHDLIERLVTTYPDTVGGLKDSSGDLDGMRLLTRAFPRLRVFSGSDRHLRRLVSAGGGGSITALNTVAGDLSAAVRDAPESEAAVAAQNRLDALRDVFRGLPLTAALKEAAVHASWDAGWRRVRPPLRPLTRDEIETVRARLDAGGFRAPATRLAPEAP